MRSPILFLIFNRPETTRQVFKAIRAARPSRLYIAADGARPGRRGEYEACAEARRIATDVDWDCEVVTLFRDENLGCRDAVAGAITWFFEHEQEGIILEDDCLPGPGFFSYMDEMLARYRNCEAIGSVSGTCFDDGPAQSQSYYYSKYSLMWGWGTWRRAWTGYRCRIPVQEIDSYFAVGARRTWPLANLARLYWRRQIRAAANGEINTWDYQWIYHCLIRGRLCVRPSRNLVENLGFSGDATHTFDADLPAAKLRASSWDVTEIVAPAAMRPDGNMDAWDERQWLRLRPRAYASLLFPGAHRIFRGAYEKLRGGRNA